jgi:sulfite reductase alpha subunit-like flavoprotein
MYELFRFHLDFLSVPRKRFFQALAHFATEPREKDKLIEFVTEEDGQGLLDYNHRAKRTHLEALQQFASAKIPFEYILDLIPHIKPREFSICSAYSANPNDVELLVALVEFRALYNRHKVGLLSSSIRTWNVGDRIALWLKKGNVALPPLRVPLIMVGPGTGLAVFRAFIQERSAAIARGENVGKAMLFFGCRHREKDALFVEEMHAHLQRGALSLFDVAYSRDQDDKVYVQHRIMQHSAEVFELLQQGAVVFVSGGARNMPRAVRETFVEVMVKEGGMDIAAAAKAQQEMQSKRYFEDTWF